MKILSFGEIVWDRYPTVSCLGGASLNFAAHLAMLGDSAELCSAVGHDELGEKTFEELEKFGVGTGYIQKNEYPTGCCNVTLDERGKPTFALMSDTAYDNISPVKPAERFDMLYFGSLIQRSEVSKNTLAELVRDNVFGDIFCDINIRPGCSSEEALDYCFNNATIIKISRDEEMILEESGRFATSDETDFVKRYTALGREICQKYGNIKIVLVTLDRDGAAVYDKERDVCLYHPPIDVPVVSTVGAGDSFGAGFAHEYLGGAPIETCLDTAVRVSSYVVSVRDAVPYYRLEDLKI